jgi:hypothetical protein
MAVQALNHFCAGGLLGADDLPAIFGFELAGKSRGVIQITEQDGERGRSPPPTQIAPLSPMFAWAWCVPPLRFALIQKASASSRVVSGRADT